MDAYEATMAVLLRGAVLGMKHAAPVLLARPRQRFEGLFPAALELGRRQAVLRIDRQELLLGQPGLIRGPRDLLGVLAA